MADGHVRHEEHEPNPWHQRSVDVVCDEVDACGAIGEGLQAGVEVEKADDVEERDGDDEGIFLPGLGVGETFKDSSQWVREQK